MSSSGFPEEATLCDICASPFCIDELIVAPIKPFPLVLAPEDETGQRLEILFEIREWH